MHAATICISVMFGGFIGWLSASLVHDIQTDSIQQQAAGAESIFSCRVAVSISGDARSFIDPAVHRSFRRYVVESIQEADCRVDVFAYAILEDDIDLVLEDNPEFAKDVTDIEASIQFLSPTSAQLVWHQAQAGIIPISCGGSTKYHTDEFPSSPGDTDIRGNIPSREQHAYWRLYGPLAAYSMARKKEKEENQKDSDNTFSYDWIVSTRFDIAWVRPLPSLRNFSPEMVWFASSTWPMNDDFSLVPWAFAERYFSAIAAFHSCDDGVWPPGESWWPGQGCVRSGNDEEMHGTNGFPESVLFRHLHAQDVPYRPYSMFDYVVRSPSGGGGGGDGERGGQGDCDGGTAAASYGTACALIGAAGLLPSNYSSGECASALSEYSNLRCQTLLGLYRHGGPSESSSDERNNKRMTAVAENILREDDTSSWEALSGLHHHVRMDRATVWEEHEEEAKDGGSIVDEKGSDEVRSRTLRVDNVRSKLVALRDAVVIPEKRSQQTAAEGAKGLNQVTTNTQKGQRETRRQQQNLPEGQDQPGMMGPEPEVEGERTYHSWTIHSQKGCRVEEYPGRAPHVVRLYSTRETLMRELALAMKCLPHALVAGTEPAGGGKQSDTASLCETGIRPLELVMIDIALHSEELGTCTADGASGLTVAENVRAFFANPATHCVGYGGILTNDKIAAGAGAGLHVPREIVDTTAQHRDTAEREAVARVVARGIGESEVEAAAAGEPTPAVGGLPDSFRVPSCPELLVQSMEVLHPKEGAVYWEGPVNVTLEVTLIGPGLKDLDLKFVHACADTEVSWPIQDWSRFCVSLEELGSPERQPSLVFGSTIGVVEGSVSLRDARPGCFPIDSTRGPILPMVERLVGGDRKTASKSIRFKIIHHEFHLQYRGRPFGPAPLGRGATAKEFIRILEKEAEEEASAAFEEMESYLNLLHGTDVRLKGDCTSRLEMNSRSSSLFASGDQVQFYVEQLEWMISEGKLPKNMEIVIDRMNELRPIFPTESTEESSGKIIILKDGWRSIGAFFQKNLLLPMPAAERVVSAMPLHTWEYDEIPWMKALNPVVDWHAVEEAYLGNRPVPITHVDNFFSAEALAVLLDLARGTSIFVDNRVNYIGAYPSEGMSHPLLYQIAEEAAERLPRILGRNTPGWPLAQMWFYVYGGNDGRRCTDGIKVHADTALVNLNVWLAPDSANLGSAETDDGGGLTVFHAKPPDDWQFEEFNRDSTRIGDFLRENDHVGNTSVPNRQNRALLFDSMLFHQSDPFRFKKGFENRRLNLTLLFGKRKPTQPTAASGLAGHQTNGKENETSSYNRQDSPDLVEVQHPTRIREVPPGQGRQLRYCL